MQLCHHIIYYDLGRTYYKNEYYLEQKKAQFDLDRQTLKISALSSGNVSKYEFLTGKDATEKD